MFTLIFTQAFDRSFSKIRDKPIQAQIWKKVHELETRALLGKKLKGNPYCSIHIGAFRVIYQLAGNQVTIADLLERKHDYQDL